MMDAATIPKWDEWADGTKLPRCFTCGSEDEKHGIYLPADVIAIVPHKDGGGKIAFAAPLCKSHMPHALVAGWTPLHDIKSAEGRKAWDEHGLDNPYREIFP